MSAARVAASAWQALPGVAPSRLGESPFWHPQEQALYWCDIPGRTLNRWRPGDGTPTRWAFDSEVACAAPCDDGTLVVALRSGLERFDPRHGTRRVLAAPPPYDPAHERYNDGKADAAGRFWVGTIYEPRDRSAAALYRWAGGELARVAGGITVSNGLAWSPGGDTLYWSDTKAHTVMAHAFDAVQGRLGPGRVFARFAPRQPGAPLASYGGRPDGAAVDAEGAYWCAMFEGARLLRLAPDGAVLAEYPLPVRCPTMPCFGGEDLRTLYVTTARENRPEDELAREPLAGCVLTLRVEVPGRRVDFVRGGA